MRLLRILLVLLGASLPALAQTNAPEIRQMSLEDCVVVALRHNLDVQIKRYNPEITRYTLKAAYGSYDPTFAISGGHDYTLSPGGVDAQGRTFLGTESDDNRLSTGFQGLLPWGLTYNLGGSMTDTYGTRPGFIQDFNQPFLVTNAFLELPANQNVSFVGTNFVSVSSRTFFENASGNIGLLQLRQPVLRNFWIDNTRLQIFLDKKNLQISELDLRNQIMMTVTAVEQAYYDLIYSQESITVQRKALELAERLLAEDSKRVQVGALAPLSEKQDQAQVATSKADLLGALGTEDTQQRVLKNLLSDEYSQWKNVAIRPTVRLIAMPQRFNLQESWDKGLSQRPDLLEQRLAEVKQVQVVRYQKNQLFPQLDVVGAYGYNASSIELGRSLNQFENQDNPFWSIGGQLSIPLGNRSARNTYRAAKASKEQLALQTKQLEQTILIQIENAIAVAETDYERVSATREARVYAEAALEAEQKKLQSGKSTSYTVLQMQRDLTTASGNEIQALAAYNKALAQLSLLEGSILERHNISLDVK